MKKYSTEARELLSNAELYEIKAGGSGEESFATEDGDCIICQSCVGCSSTCTTCTTKMMDVILVP